MKPEELLKMLTDAGLEQEQIVELLNNVLELVKPQEAPVDTEEAEKQEASQYLGVEL